eukprot:COSAG04_NODE_835_length_9985_cov_10.447603_7_plen_41_part_00
MWSWTSASSLSLGSISAEPGMLPAIAVVATSSVPGRVFTG